MACTDNVVKGIDYSKPINAHKLCILVNLREAERLIFEALQAMETEDKKTIRAKVLEVEEKTKAIIPAIDTWNCNQETKPL